MGRNNCVQHIKVRAGCIYHHGMILRDGDVVHYTGSENRTALEDGKIVKESYKNFTKKYKGDVKVVSCLWYNNAARAEKRALACVGIDDQYELASFNCESFVEWCFTGNPVSYQVERFVEKLAAGLICGGVGGAIIAAGSTFLCE